MIAALEERVSRCATELADRVMAGPSKTFLLDGRPGSGRSGVLHKTAATLSAAGFLPVVVSPPERQFDTSSLAALECGVGLSNLGFADHIDRWTYGAPWRDRLNDLRGWLSAVGDQDSRFVLLCDDPAQWAIPEAHELPGRIDGVTDLLLRETRCTRVVVGSGSTLPFHERFTIDDGPGLPLFDDETGWGALWPDARRAQSELPGIETTSAAHVALAVAYSALGGLEDLASWWSRQISAEHVADRLVALVAATGRLRPLWNAWLVASLPRRALPRSRFAREFAAVRDEGQRAVLDICITVGADPVALTREARAAVWRRPLDGFADRVVADAASRFQAEYLEDFEASSREGAATALLYGAEAIHMAARTGDTEVVNLNVATFADQLSTIGRAAQDRQDWPAAATAFDLAVSWDPDDAYAHHQLAFSLDAEAREPRRAETEYRRALELDPTHAAWHARLISFLVVRARADDAWFQWNESRTALTADRAERPAELYSKLHMPVGANAVRRAEFVFAREVLDDISPSARAQLIGYDDLFARLVVLQDAELSGSVIPAQRATTEWWLSGPELLADRSPDGASLVYWIAGGVEGTDADGIHLAVAVVRGVAPPIRGTMTIAEPDLARFVTDSERAARLAVGDFIEVGYYGEDPESDPVVRVLPNKPWETGLQTELDPRRYIRRGPWPTTS
jgi:tetratricopeptide (TPR) repeat protein